MSLGNDRATVARVQKEIGELQKKQAEEMRKAATASKNMHSTSASAAKATSASTAGSYLRTAEREAGNANTAQERAARYGADIAGKTTDLIRAQERVFTGEEKERKDQTSAYEKQQREQAAAYDKQRKADEASRKQLQDVNRSLARDVNALRAQITAAMETQATNSQPFVVENTDGRDLPYDFFISHTWKDKEDFVDGLVEKAKLAGLDVWYDSAAMEWGESIRQKIDDGLRRSYFGVVVLSPNFFERPWTQYELDGIVQRDLTGAGRLLPIWHRLTQDDVAKRAPSLAGRLALPTSSYSTDQIVAELLTMRDKFKAAAR